MIYTLSATEFAVLIVTDTLICATGYILFRQWSRRDLTPPVWVVSVMSVVAFVAFGLVARQLWLNADHTGAFAKRTPVEAVAGEGDFPGAAATEHAYATNARLMASRGQVLPTDAGKRPVRVPLILMYCLAFWTVPVGYYGYVLIGSVGAWWEERKSWMTMEVPDAEFEFDDNETFERAKELALNGDMVAAVGGPKTFSKNRTAGCFAAERVLEANGRYAEAAALLEEIANQSAGSESTWAEAIYRLAVIHERCLTDLGCAAKYYLQVATRCPANEFGEMAQVALQRMQPWGQDLLKTLDAGFSTQGSSAEAAGVGTV